ANRSTGPTKRHHRRLIARRGPGEPTGHLLDAVHVVADDPHPLDREAGVGQPIDQPLCLVIGGVLAQHQRLRRSYASRFGHFRSPIWSGCLVDNSIVSIVRWAIDGVDVGAYNAVRAPVSVRTAVSHRMNGLSARSV